MALKGASNGVTGTVTMTRRIMLHIVRLGFISCLVLTARADAQGNRSMDIEGGVVFSGYNDVRIPGTGGTLFSLVDDLETDPAVFVRVRFTHRVGERHIISLLAAPLRLDAQGSVPAAILFSGKTFPPDTPLEARYRFDSYRFTYRYELHRSSDLRAGLGITAKIRDAAVSVAGGGMTAEKTNTGLVPLINFSVVWMPCPRLSLLFEGDALAAPQGRAEDVLVALVLVAGKRLSLRAGYRLLEGGADNDEVYNFALLHYAVLGASLSF
jgi:hypothetical protein